MFTLCFIFYTILLCISASNPTETAEQTTELIELHTRIYEERPVGQVILRLPEEVNKYDHQGEQKSSSPTKHLRFHLLPTQDSALFFVNADGSLINSKRLDYEELCDSTRVSNMPANPLHLSSTTDVIGTHSPVCQLKLRLLAIQIEQFNSSLSKQRNLRTVLLKIILMDTNDNRPRCNLQFPRKSDSFNYPSGSDTIDIPENIPPGTVIAVWKLIDQDSDANGITHVRLFGTKNGKSTILSGELPFHLQFDPVITPQSFLDVKLVVTKSMEYLEERGSANHPPDSNQDMYDLKIIVLDSNDIGTSLQWSPNMISSSIATSCTIQVRIVDINDHSPEWISPVNFASGQPLELELIESKSYQQRELIRLQALDADRGPNARIVYSWATDRNHNHNQLRSLPVHNYQELISRLFYLDTTSGSLQLRGTNVDFETVSRLYFQVPDSGKPPGRIALPLSVVALDQPLNQSEQRSSPVGLITIWLIDINDNSPQIQIIGLHSPASDPTGLHRYSTNSVPAYIQTLFISENLPPNEPVAFITVTDEDSDAYGGIMCNLRDAIIDASSDHTLSASHNFQLIKLMEHTAGETVDPFISSVKNVEQVGSTANYKLITTRCLDREKTPLFRLNISCVDSQTSSISAIDTMLTSYRIVEVIVSDMNDNPPRIVAVSDQISVKLNKIVNQKNDLVCLVREHEAPGTKICQLLAEDADQQGSADERKKYENTFEWWLEDSVRSLVDVEKETGWLVVQNSMEGKNQSSTGQTINLDREILGEISFTVFVRDGSKSGVDKRLTASTTVTLQVLDINDNVPKISEYNYFQVSEAAAPGTLIGTLVAVDADQSGTPNSELRYHIYSHGNTLEENLHHSIQRNYSQQTHTYREIMNNEFLDIKLDEKTGTLLVGANGLDRERVSSYKFVVLVSDGAAVGSQPALPPRERNVAQTVVHINVEDENDNIPRIIYPEGYSTTFTLACTMLQNKMPHTIVQIVVNDSDVGNNAEVLYYLSPVSGDTPSLTTNSQRSAEFDALEQNETSPEKSLMYSNETVILTPLNAVSSNTNILMPFQIDSHSGLLMIVNSPENENHADICSLDHSQTGLSVYLAEYRMRVVVTDRGIPPLSSSVVITVRVVPTVTGTLSSSSNLPIEIVHQRPLDRAASQIRSPDTSKSAFGPGNRNSPSVRKFQQPAFSSSSTDQRNNNQQFTILNSLSSPDIFWAATICLTVATGVLIFLILLITMVTCQRRLKAPTTRGGTQQNEWVQSDEVQYDAQLSQRSFDNVEMSASKNSTKIPEDLFLTKDNSSVNYYMWTNQMTSPMPMRRNSPLTLDTIGYSTLMQRKPYLCKQQILLAQHMAMQHDDAVPIFSSQNALPRASNEGYQTLIPSCDIAVTSSLDKIGVHRAGDEKNGLLESPICSKGEFVGFPGIPQMLPSAESPTNLKICVQNHTQMEQEHERKNPINKKKNEVSFV